jgi:hypothetical protein
MSDSAARFDFTRIIVERNQGLDSMADNDDSLTPEEIARRRDAAIRRALNTPKPAKRPKATSSSKGTRAKRRAGRGGKT